VANKTQATEASMVAFVASLADERQRADSERLIALMSQVTGELATMWGTSIIGFGSYHYRYASGRQGDAPLVGFSPRKSALVLYASVDDDVRADLLARLGPHKVGKGCVYVKRLSDVDEQALVELIRAGAAFTRAQHVAP
jgi:nucleoid DNA-binding protein